MNELIYYRIQLETERKRKLLMEKRKYIKEHQKDNEFLNDVKQSYMRYYQTLLDEKQKQVQAVQKIYEHLEALEKANKRADDEIDVIQSDKTDILNELTNLKYELDELVLASDDKQ
jgi:hypothetical protein